MKPLVSIIIPTYNRASGTIASIQSVLEQTYTNWECIIVDDGSTDDTEKLVRDYAKNDSRIYFLNRSQEKPKGANACRNIGIENAQGKYYIFLDADDYLLPDCLDIRVNYMLDHNEELSYAVFLEERENKTERSVPKHFLKSTTSHKQALLAFFNYEMPWRTTGPIWHKRVFKNIQWDESLLRLQDIDLHINVLQHSEFKFDKVSQVTSVFKAAARDKKEDTYHALSVLNSFPIFFTKVWGIAKEDKAYKNACKRLVLFFKKNYLVPNKQHYKQEIKTIYKQIEDARVFSTKERWVTNLEFFNLKRKQAGKKQITGHRIHQLFKKTFNIP